MKLTRGQPEAYEKGISLVEMTVLGVDHRMYRTSPKDSSPFEVVCTTLGPFGVRELSPPITPLYHFNRFRGLHES
jgi:hypothetical protein